MKNELMFKKVDNGPSLFYRYDDPIDKRITGKIECTETDLFSDLHRLIDLTRRYMNMCFIVAEEQPGYFDAASAEMVGEQLFRSHEQRIEEIFNLLEQKQGKPMIATVTRGNGHVDDDQVVDVYFDESRKR
ncbi:MAG: hypothetical protein NTV99_11695 [Deltaproteobacteria bacterium]|nr:hypothetical protein [Deltaproteobacteria bacterium]